MPHCLSFLLSSLSSPETAPLLEKSLSEKHHVPAPQSTTGRLQKLRALMAEQDIDAYVIPTGDAHGSEYVGECDKRRAWISGFSGSAGTAIVTAEVACLFTDSRYHVQAAKELDPNWTLFKVGLRDVDDWYQYLTKARPSSSYETASNTYIQQLPTSSKIGLDPSLFSTTSISALTSTLQLVFPSANLIDTIWTSRPPRSSYPITLHSLEFSGCSTSDKLSNLRGLIPEGQSYLLASLPNIAWFLNMRGSDIPFNPVFYAYVLVDKDSLIVWAQEASVDKEVRSAVEELGGKVEDYEGVWDSLKGRKIMCDGKVSRAIVEAIGEDNVTIIKSLIDGAQAIKNSTEIQGFRNAYLRDGVAWVRWAAWLEEKIEAGKEVTEWEAAEELTRYRQLGEHFRGLAYDNISATGENAALPHYAPTSKGSPVINTTTPYLNDSGAQYLDGTIDTTRTVHFGSPTKEQRRAFTRVVQGHMEVDTLIFPSGTTGFQVDVLARKYLWSEGMDYMHGTGHGVGEYLGVHEGPQGIGPSLSFQATPFVPGHVMSNEPAYYEVGHFGIRIESVLVVKDVSTRRSFGDKTWLGFDRFTVVPIQTKMIDTSLMSKAQNAWLATHNKQCRQKLAPFLRDDKRALKYLRSQ